MNYFLTGTDTGVGKACRKIGFRYGQLCVFAPPREFVSPAEALRRGGFSVSKFRLMSRCKYTLARSGMGQKRECSNGGNDGRR